MQYLRGKVHAKSSTAFDRLLGLRQREKGAHGVGAPARERHRPASEGHPLFRGAHLDRSAGDVPLGVSELRRVDVAREDP
jgi:hypothetical protein